jgi:hypothetical protein
MGWFPVGVPRCPALRAVGRVLVDDLDPGVVGVQQVALERALDNSSHERLE